MGLWYIVCGGIGRGEFVRCFMRGQGCGRMSVQKTELWKDRSRRIFEGICADHWETSSRECRSMWKKL
jgi:hypothetical protein